MSDERKQKMPDGNARGTDRGISAPRGQALLLLVTVVNREKADFYMDLLQGFEVNMQMAFGFRGTASTETLEYLGQASRNRAVIFSLIRREMVDAACRALEERFRTIRDGKGIAFTVPLRSTVGVAIYQFLCNHQGKGGISVS